MPEDQRPHRAYRSPIHPSEERGTRGVPPSATSRGEEDAPNWELVTYHDPLRLDFQSYVLIPKAEAQGFGDQFPPVDEAIRRWPSLSKMFK